MNRDICVFVLISASCVASLASLDFCCVQFAGPLLQYLILPLSRVWVNVAHITALFVQQSEMRILLLGFKTCFVDLLRLCLKDKLMQVLGISQYVLSRMANSFRFAIQSQEDQKLP